MDAVADWWLAMGCAVLGMVAAAAAPATTMVNAKMRMASFIKGNLRWIWFDRKYVSCTPKS
jgi:predicted Zn-dependent protease